MNEDKERQGATVGDVFLSGVTSGDKDYSLSIEEALVRYEAAGIPRTRRAAGRINAILS